MQRPVVKWDWNIGNIITLVVIVFGAIVGYTRLEASSSDNSRSIVKLEAKDDSIQRQIDLLKDNFNQQQLQVNGKLSRIETILERIEKKQSP